MIRRPPRSTLTDPRFPNTTLFRSGGMPGDMEQRFDLTAYIARLRRALAALHRQAGRPPVLLGYCMGGNLALAAALQAPDDVAALALLATPWDFHAGGAHPAALVQSLAPALVQLGRASGRERVCQ